jgi:hypothetical protein
MKYHDFDAQIPFQILWRFGIKSWLENFLRKKKNLELTTTTKGCKKPPPDMSSI